MHPLFAWPLVDWRFAHASVPPTSLQARRSGFVLMKLCMKTKTRHGNRVVRRCSGSSTPHHPGLSSTAPHLHLHHQPRVILQVSLAWPLFLAAAAHTRLMRPLLRPPPGSPLLVYLVFAQNLLPSRRVCAGDAPRRFHCLPCAPLEARAVLPFGWNRLPWSPSTFRVPGRTREAFLMLDKGISWVETLSLGAWARLTLPLLRPPPASPLLQGVYLVFDCHGVLRPGECRGAREKLF